MEAYRIILPEAPFASTDAQFKIFAPTATLSLIKRLSGAKRRCICGVIEPVNAAAVDETVRFGECDLRARRA